mmetsp:Transcript_2419/g.3779  ORF Transcript_2419/g.3779 Transcript_2419/m.3779 type:complete len:146 (-) Transcript_2419:388-825(-)
MPRILSRSNLGSHRGSRGSSLTSLSSVGSASSLNRRRKVSATSKPSDQFGTLRRSSMDIPRDNRSKSSFGRYSMPALSETEKAQYMEDKSNEEWGFFVTGSTSTNNLSSLGSSMYPSSSSRPTTGAFQPSLAPIMQQKPNIFLQR